MDNKRTFAEITGRIKKDVSGYALGIILCGIYIGIMTAAFGAVCPARIFTGLPCPGCGLSRAALLMARGELAASLKMHPMLLYLLACTAWGFYVRYFTACPGKYKKYGEILLIAGVFLFIAVYIVRIRRYFPDQPPMVYEPDNMMSRIFPAWGRRWPGY